MKKIFILVSIFILSLGCNNKKEKTINQKNMEEEILKSIKKYDNKPYYIVKIQAQACYYEILLNDILVVSYGASGGISNELPLNYYILKSGKQLLKIRLSPMFSNLKLSKQVDFNLNVGFNNITGEKILGEYIENLKFDLPVTVKNNELPLFEIELPFEAKVPWDYSQNFENAQNLKSNPKINSLVNEIVNKLHGALLNKDQNIYNNIYLNTLVKQSDVMYSSQKEIKESVDFMNLSKVKSVLPIPEYEIRFYGNGKIARVLGNIKDEYGNRYVIKYKVAPLKEGGQDGESSEDQLFYLPKGKTELEIF